MSNITGFFPLWGNWYLDGAPVRRKGQDSPFLGAGTYGDVWRVRREHNGRREYAAVKHISIPRDEMEIDHLIEEGIISSEASKQAYYEHEKQALMTEINTMRNLRGYLNIVSYEEEAFFTKPDGVGFDVFLRMELLIPLDQISDRLNKQQIVKLGADIATAIEVINRHGYVHRDIKPQNIFANLNGDYKLGDFGTARVLRSNATAMSVKGTYNYMAPEIFHRKEAGRTVDIYSLGLMLYRLLNRNRMPFVPMGQGQVTSEMVDHALAIRLGGGEKMAPPCDADPDLAAIILKCCEFEPKKRWRSGEELRKALAAYQQRQGWQVNAPEKTGGNAGAAGREGHHGAGAQGANQLPPIGETSERSLNRSRSEKHGSRQNSEKPALEPKKKEKEKESRTLVYLLPFLAVVLFTIILLALTAQPAP